MAPKDDLDLLLNDALEMAAELITKHGAHIPFAMVITRGGVRENLAADAEKGIDADELYDSLSAKVREGATRGQFRAVAVARNIEYQPTDAEETVDAIQVTLDHLKEPGCTCYLPYGLGEDNEFEPGEFFVEEPITAFFRAPPPAG